VLECGSLFILVLRRRSAIVWLLAICLFHVGIVALSGIFLWQWLIVDGATAIAIFRYRTPVDKANISGAHIALSVGLIAFAPVWLRGPQLSWYDSPIKYTYHFEAVTKNGASHELPAQSFAPFDKQFALQGFAFLANVKMLDDSDVATGRAIQTTKSPAAVLAMETSSGINVFDASRTTKMSEFLIRFVTNYNRNPDHLSWLHFVAPPPGIITSRREPRGQVDLPITGVNVYQVLSYYDGSTYQELRRTKVLSVAIPNS
jgi:hypothetical protein